MRIELDGNIIGEIGGLFVEADLNEGTGASPCWVGEADERTVKLLEAQGLRIVFVRHEDNTLVVVKR